MVASAPALAPANTESTIERRLSRDGREDYSNEEQVMETGPGLYEAEVCSDAKMKIQRKLRLPLY